MAVYDINGIRIDNGGGGSASVFIPDESPSFYDKICKSINHRGWRRDGATENTLAAFKASKTNGFYYVETDARYTSDSVAILYHDDYINGTAISNMTYAQVLAAVPTITLFEDFIELCRDICLHPYIELKGSFTQTQMNALVDTVHAHQIGHQSSWFGSYTNVSKVQSYDSEARVGILSNTLTSTNITNAQSLKLDTNDVWLATYQPYLTTEILNMVKSAGIPLGVYTIDTASTIEGLDRYITEVTSDYTIAGKVLYDAGIE